MKLASFALGCMALLAAVSVVAAKPAAKPPARTPAGPWGQIAQRDIDELHRLLVANHPGQVDPLSDVFRKWNLTGYAEAGRRAAQARNFYDYKRAIQFFTNGFEDDHVEVRWDVDALSKAWPGFIVAADSPTSVKVAYSDTVGIPVGAKLVACDGVPAAALLQQRVLPFYWNPKLPRELPFVSTRLTVVDGAEAAARFQRCAFEVEGQRRETPLSWRIIPTDRALALQQAAVGWVHPDMDVTQKDGVWFVSLNTLRINTPQDAAAFRAFLAKIDANRDALRRGPVVLDARGVPGGVSSWGDEVIAHLYGKDWADYAQSVAGGGAIDWRVSPDNIARHEDIVRQIEANGQGEEEAKFYRDLVRRMREALTKGEPFVRTGEREVPRPRPAANPVTGGVYLLTDGICKSACLDFVDATRQLPDVCPIGRPTGADTNYMENTFRNLPSGFGRFTYSQKVDRERPRGPNAWYEPSVIWDGGPMTDEAMARWVKELEPRRRADPAMCRPQPARRLS